LCTWYTPSGGGALRAQDGAEPGGERVDDAGTDCTRLLVGERPLGRAERDAEGERALALPQLRAAVLVEDLRLAQLGRPRLAERGEQRAGRHLLVDDEREILAHLGERRDLRVRHGGGRRRRERVEIELERPPRPVERRRVQLAEPALGRPRRLAGMEQQLLPALHRRRQLQGRVHLLDRPGGVGDAALDDPRHVPGLDGQRLAARRVHPRDLEERDVAVAPRDVLPRRLDERRRERRAQRGGFARERLGQAVVALRDERRGVRLREAAADERVLDDAPRTLPRRQAPEGDVPARQRERDLVHPEARDLFDEVDLARRVARAPRRDAVAVACTLEPDPAEDLRRVRHLEAEHRRHALRPQRDHRRLGQVALHVGRARPARAG
jgi:hypothetical protein